MNKFQLNFLTAAITAFIAAGGLSSCAYDDSDLWNELSDHENRIAMLESLCSQINTNITALQTIVTALQDNDYVTSIVPVTQEGETIGYTINFSKSGAVTIYHGKDGKDGENGTDGKDGHTPVIGIRQDADGYFYWTLDGEWMLDDNGNKIRANGIDGADGNDGTDGQNGNDGITPQLKIEDGYWHISYDNGSTWEQLGKATGDDGSCIQDGNRIFSKVTYDDEYVYLVLADNTTTLVLPRKSEEFDLLFTDGNELTCSSGETVSIPYTLTYGDEKSEVAAIPHGGWDARVDKTDNISGNIIVTAPSPMRNGEIIVLASDGKGKTIMKKLLFAEGIVTVANKSYLADSNASTVEVEISTNLDYTISIPADAQSWISVEGISTKAAMRDDVISLSLTANLNNSTRTANVSFVNSANEVLNTVTISQTGAEIADNEIWYRSSDGNIIEPDIYNFAGNIVSNTYGNGKGLIVFEEDLTEIWDEAFWACSTLVEITIPDVIESINYYAFAYTSLTKFIIPNSVKSIGESAFRSCPLHEITIPNSVENIDREAFAFSDIEEIHLPSSISTLKYELFSFCEKLVQITIPNTVTTIESRVFINCISLTDITIPTEVKSIGNQCFSGCSKLEAIYCQPSTPPEMENVLNSSLGISTKTKIYVPTSSVEQYKTAERWSQYASRIIGYDFPE